MAECGLQSTRLAASPALREPAAQAAAADSQAPPPGPACGPGPARRLRVRLRDDYCDRESDPGARPGAAGASPGERRPLCEQRDDRPRDTAPLAEARARPHERDRAAHA